MAHIVEEAITITFSRIVKEGETAQDSAITAEIIDTLESVAQELAGASVVVEVKG